MPLAMQAWVLWDFATFQIVYNGLTGESRRVHGEGACFEGGPFKLVWNEEYPGRAILVGLGSEDGSAPAVHFLDETGVASVAWSADGTRYKVTPPSRGDKPEHGRWCTELWEEVQEFDVQLVGARQEPVRLHFCRTAAPQLVGDVPVSLWVTWASVWEWLVGRTFWWEGLTRLRYDKGYLAAVGICTQRGLDEGHFWSVAASEVRPWKRRREGSEVDQCDADAGELEGLSAQKDYRVSVQGLLHWLWCVVERGYVQRTHRVASDVSDAQLERARELLRMLLQWPLELEGSPVVGVASESAMCVTVLDGARVNGAELCASEERMRSWLQDKRAGRTRWDRI